MGTDARVFYIALLSLQPRRQNNLKRNTGTASLQTSTPTPNRAPPTPTTGLTPNPSPLGEGLGVRPVVGACQLYVRLSLRRFWRQFHIKQAIFFHHKRFGAIASEGETEGGTNAGGERILAAGVSLRRLSVGRYLYAN